MDLLKGKMSKVERKTIETRMESLLVEWGVAPAVVSNKPDYNSVAQLLAVAAVVAE